MVTLKVKIIILLIVALWGGLAYRLASKTTDGVVPDQSSIFGRSIYDNSVSAGRSASQDYIIKFPQDHAAHFDFDIEWWYLTANLKDTQGHIYGVQWTLFRFRNPQDAQVIEGENPWNNEQIFMAHASVHSESKHWFSERFARGGVGNAGVTNSPFSLRLDEWQWTNINGTKDLLPSTLSFNAADKDNVLERINVELNLQQTGPLVLHGENGYSIKSLNAHASHYYSAPFIDVSGTLTFKADDGSSELITVNGNAWFDQEWTSQLLDTNTLGWDWLSLHLDNGSKLMAFRMRLNNQPNFITGSFISANGVQTTLLPGDLELSPIGLVKVNNKNLPLKWRLIIPDKQIDLTVISIKEDQWNPAFIPYYEGMVSVSGTHVGKGFLELTGY